VGIPGGESGTINGKDRDPLHGVYVNLCSVRSLIGDAGVCGKKNAICQQTSCNYTHYSIIDEVRK